MKNNNQISNKTDYPALSEIWGPNFEELQKEAEARRNAVILSAEDQAAIDKYGRPEFTPFNTINAAELYTKDIPPVYWIVKGLISEGITFLSAKSKVGKSWLCLDLAYSVSNGRDFLGFKTTKSKVLYMALEDSKSRLQDRLKRCYNCEVLAGVELMTERLPFDDVIGRLKATLEADPEIRLVMIDTYQKIKPDRKKGQSDYEHDYGIISTFQDIAFKYHVGILFTHHNRKSQGFINDKEADPFDDVLGSTALQGACDNILVIKINRKQSDDVAKLYTTSKDADNNALAIKFNKQRYRWENYGDVTAYENRQLLDKYEKDPAVKLIKEYVGKYGIYETTIKDLREYIMQNDQIVLGNSEHELGKIIDSYDDLLFQDGIRHTSKRTTRNKRRAIFHTFTKMEV